MIRPMHKEFMKEVKNKVSGRLIYSYNEKECRLELRVLDWMSYYELMFYIDDGTIFEASVNCIYRNELCRKIAELFQHHLHKFTFENEEYNGPLEVK